MNRFLLSLSICAALAGCGSDPYEPRDPDPAKPSPEPERDYTEIIADRTVRAQLPAISMSYGKAGVMYLCRASAVSFIDLNNGGRIDFDATVPSLSIDGHPAEIKSCQVIHSEGTLQWHILTLADDGGEAIIVSDSLQ